MDTKPLEGEALEQSERTPGLVFTTNRQLPRGQPATVGRIVTALETLLAEQDTIPTAVILQPPTRS
jgi:hypothetical protein